MAAYFSEVGYTDDPENFFEVAVPAGTDTSGYVIAIYDGSGVLQDTMTFDSATGTMFGSDIYVFDEESDEDVEYGASEAAALIDGDGNVVQFVSFEGKSVSPTEGPAAGSTSTDLGFLESGETFETTDDGATYVAQLSPNPGTIPCYAPGTMIDTPDGSRAVETLACSDLVAAGSWATTCDVDTPRHICTQGRVGRQQTGSDQGGGLGRWTAKARSYRIATTPYSCRGVWSVERIFGTQAFAPAKSLTGLPGIRFMRGRKQIEWIHFACPAHEVVFAAGALSESLLLGPMVVQGLPVRDRAGLCSIFGRSVTGLALNGPAVRDCLTVGQVREALRQDNGQMCLAA